MPAATVDLASFTIESDQPDGSVMAQCHLAWSESHGLFRAWDDNGHEAFSGDPHCAALKLFAKRRYVEFRDEQPVEPRAKISLQDILTWGTVALLAAIMFALLIAGGVFTARGFR